MNNRFPVVSLIAFVILILAAAYVATAMLPDIRKTMYGDAKAQLERTYMPMAAFDKFYADAQWVATVQEMGGSGSSNKAKDAPKKTEEEEKAERAKEADRLYSKLDFLSDLDPNNKNLYEVGAMFISNDRPEKAIELLKKGDSLLMKNPSYKFPFNQYHIINNVICMNNDEAKKAHRKEMIDLLAKAMDRSGAPEYVQNQWLRLRAEESGYDDNSIGRLKLWRDYYRSKVRAMGNSTGNSEGKPDEKPAEDASMASGDSFASTERGSALLAQVMRMAQTMAIDNFKKRQEKGANVAALKEEHKKISDIFFSVAPAGHYGPESLHPYEAGDLFDVYTGTPLKPYGVDPDMLQEGRVVIYKGDFSHVTGKPRSEDYSKFKHDEFLRKVNAAK